ncbi:MAG: hypothetical protein ACXADC_05515 [Candidatus Thorarchaeota archaeon]|jgi:hypothetical protein
MSENDAVRELFVIHSGGIPINHVGTGTVKVDDALLGGLLAALSEVGLTLGLSEDGALEAITFRGYHLVYARTENALIVMLTSDESADFYNKSRNELEAIGRDLESAGLLEDPSIRTPDKLAEIAHAITRNARSIFARQNDVFIWSEDHTFQLAKSANERWSGDNLFQNYLLLSPLSKALTIPVADLRRICQLLVDLRKPSELIEDPEISIKDPQVIEDTVRFMHIYGMVHCFGTSIAE